MKHRATIILILLGMFLVSQFIGLAVVNSYTAKDLPFGLQEDVNASAGIENIIFSVAIAIGLIFLLMKYKVKWVMRIWFFVVVMLALSISIYGLTKNYTTPLITLSIGGVLALAKTFRPTKYIHNITELFIYPGIAAIFVPLLNIYTIIFFLILISVYDIWAVWHSGIMQKMAKFQMEEVGIFGGFLVPSLTKKQKERIKKFKLQKRKTKNKTKRKFKVSLAILGGGDVVFPIITAGVFLRTFNSITPSLFIIFGALAGLTYLFLRSEEKKSYPAMPYITGGIFIGLILWILLVTIL